MLLKTISLLLLILITNPVFAQLEGKVVSAITGEGIPAIIILRAGDETIELSADQEGYFVSYLQPDTNRLTVFKEGYESRHIQFPKNKKFIHISLYPLHVTLSDVVVTAYPVEKRLQEIPASVFSIPINRGLSGKINISTNEYLNSIPGVMHQSGTITTNRLTLRGLGARTPYVTSKVKIYLDEIPLTNGVGETDLEDIDLTQISSLEVYTGPSATLYGTGLAGSVIFKTNQGAGSTIEASSSLKLGSYNHIHQQYRAAVHVKDFSISASSAILNDDGFRENNATNRVSHFLHSNFSINKTSSLGLMLYHTDLLAYIPSSIDRETFLGNPSEAAFTWKNIKGYEDSRRTIAGLNYSNQFNRFNSLVLTAWFNDGHSYELRPFGQLDTETSNTGLRGRYNYDGFFHGIPFRLESGMELLGEKFNWQTMSVEPASMDSVLNRKQEYRWRSDIFFNGRIDLTKNWSFESGINLNYSAYEVLDDFVADSLETSGTHAFNPVFNPRLSLLYRIDQQNNLYFTYSQGFSMPSLEETLLPDGRKNFDIKQERGINYEVGLKGRIGQPALWYHFSAYVMNIKDLIVLERFGDDSYMALNAGRAFNSGLSAYADWPGFQTNTWTASVQLSYTYTNFKYSRYTNEGSDFSGKKVPGVPVHQSSTGLHVTAFKLVYFDLNGLYVSEIPLNDANTSYADPYFVANASMGIYKHVFSGFRLSIGGEVKNLADQNYASMVLVNAPSFGGQDPRYYYPGLPRSFYGWLKLSYHFY